MMAGIARGIRVSVKLLRQRNLERSFFLSFPHRCALDTLAVIDKAAGLGPSMRQVFSFDQHDAAVGKLDDDIDRQQRIAKFLAHVASLT